MRNGPGLSCVPYRRKGCKRRARQRWKECRNNDTADDDNGQGNADFRPRPDRHGRRNGGGDGGTRGHEDGVGQPDNEQINRQ